MLAKMVEKGRFEEADDELCEHQYSMLCETLAQAGYHHYEISNFAILGHEAMHNSAYWKHVPYVGLGPGAHSFDSPDKDGRPSRSWNLQDLQTYLTDPSSVRESEDLDQQQLVLEKIMLALRTSDGISAGFLNEQCDAAGLARAFDAGSLVLTPSGKIRIPENRFFVSDGIISEIV